MSARPGRFTRVYPAPIVILTAVIRDLRGDIDDIIRYGTQQAYAWSSRFAESF
jgi:hypothetical protein